MKKVVYITYPWFLDFAIEYIKELSKHVELHVIVLCPENRNSGTIFHLEKKIDFQRGKFYSLGELSQNLKDAKYFEEYTQHCSSFFFSFSPAKWYSLKSLQYNYSIFKYIKKIDPCIIHLDDLSIEIMWLSFFIRKRRIVIDVHDPLPHSGEQNYRRDIIRKLYYPLAHKFITYSRYSAKVFFENYKRKAVALSLTPYTFYNKYKINESPEKRKYILFFGRISAYKGIEKLIKAFSQLRSDYRDIDLIIAGKSVYGYQINPSLYETEGVIIDDRFIPNDEMATLFRNCEFVVCPYEDASQSGVVMTAFAFKKKLVVSMVGGLFEVINDTSGIVYEGDENNLVEALRLMLNSENMISPLIIAEENTVEFNAIELLKIYKEIYNDK